MSKTYNKNNANKNYLRHPRNVQEKRAYFAAIEQGYKPRRSIVHIVDDWDDIPVQKSNQFNYWK